MASSSHTDERRLAADKINGRTTTSSHLMAWRIAVLAMVLASFFLRTFRLDRAGLEGDEAFSISLVSQNVESILKMTASGEPHPPLYYLTLHAWINIAGTSEFSLRFPSVVASVLAVVFLIKLAEVLSWRRAGLVAAAFMMLNTYQLWYAQEARMYTMAACFGSAAIYFALRDQQRPSKWSLAAYVATMVLGLYSHYYVMFLCLFINLFVLAQMWQQGKQAANFIRWIVAQLPVAVLFLPWLAYASSITFSYAGLGKETMTVLRETLQNFTLGTSVSSDWLVVSWVFLAIGVVGLWFAWRSRRGSTPWLRLGFLVGYALLPMALGYVISFWRPMFKAQYLFVSSPAFCLAVGLGIVALWQRKRIVGTIVALVLLVALSFSLYNYYFDYKYIKSDFGDAAKYVLQHVRPDDAVILDGLEMQPYQAWYYFTLRAPQPIPTHVFPDDTLSQEAQEHRLDEIMASYSGAWFMDWDVMANDPARFVETHLAKAHYQALFQRAGLNRVVYYASAGNQLPKTTTLNVTCNQELLLQEVDVYGTSAKVGENVPFAVHVRALKDITRQYAFSWRLIDGQGRAVYQRDAEPASGFVSTTKLTEGEEIVDRFAMPIPSYLTPGTYSVILVPTDKGAGTSCHLRQGDKDLGTEQVLLSTLEVQDTMPIKSITETAPTHPSNYAFGQVTMLGYDWPIGEQRAGGTMTVKTYWRADKDIDRDYQIVARLSDQNGRMVQETSTPLGTATYPSSRWKAGREALTFVDVQIPRSASSGDYTLSLTLRADGAEEKAYLGFPTVPVTARERSYTLPQPENKKGADFGGLIELLGYDLQPTGDQPITAGEQLTLTLYWRATREMNESYKVFTHLLGPDGQIYGQTDDFPLNGNAPTDSWTAGEVLTDSYQITVKPGAPSGQYKLEIGFYRPEDGKRIALTDGSGDGLILTTFK